MQSTIVNTESTLDIDSLLQVYLKAHFSYDPKRDNLVPSRDAALSFKEGDILQVLNMDDPNWWQVRARITWSLRSASVMLCWGCFRRRRWTRTGLAV